MALQEEAAAARNAARAAEEVHILKESGVAAENVKAAEAEADQLIENADLAAATEATLKVVYLFIPNLPLLIPSRIFFFFQFVCLASLCSSSVLKIFRASNVTVPYS